MQVLDQDRFATAGASESAAVRKHYWAWCVCHASCRTCPVCISAQALHDRYIPQEWAAVKQKIENEADTSQATLTVGIDFILTILV